MSPVTLWQKVGAGIFIILTIICWAFFKVTLSSKETGKSYVVFFEESVRGLAPSSLVCYNGIPVGKVVKLTNDLNKNRVKIKIMITDPQIRVFAVNKNKKDKKEQGTKAKLITYLMTGLQYIDLQGFGDQELNEGQTIPTTKDNLVDRLEGKFNAISKQTEKFTMRLNDVLSEQNIEHLSGVIANADAISANIATVTSAEKPDGIPYRLNAILENANRLVSEDSEVDKILKNVAVLTDPKKNGITRLIHDMRKELTRVSRSMDKLINNLNGLVDSKGKKEDATQTLKEVNLLLRENRRNVSQIMGNLNRLSSTADKKLLQISNNANKTVITFNHFLQKELYQASSRMSVLLSELASLVQILKAKPNALLWGSEVRRK
ncbi:MlaD family protein [Candidatus Uabimicrobium sp. HlEnr_7]|uniref:MlaD family protein n=1 Tax=Candidatus Uabimicrobium helgolandensis TaxID=3095367 RepID=UPI0035590911